jgi:hypothetical protein
MKTAQEYAKTAAQIGQLAVLMKPADDDPYGQARKLIQFHLQSAATKTREIAEAIASKEDAEVEAKYEKDRDFILRAVRKEGPA